MIHFTPIIIYLFVAKKSNTRIISNCQSKMKKVRRVKNSCTETNSDMFNVREHEASYKASEQQQQHFQVQQQKQNEQQQQPEQQQNQIYWKKKFKVQWDQEEQQTQQHQKQHQHKMQSQTQQQQQQKIQQQQHHQQSQQKPGYRQRQLEIKQKNQKKHDLKVQLEQEHQQKQQHQKQQGQTQQQQQEKQQQQQPQIRLAIKRHHVNSTSSMHPSAFHTKLFRQASSSFSERDNITQAPIRQESCSKEPEKFPSYPIENYSDKSVAASHRSQAMPESSISFWSQNQLQSFGQGPLLNQNMSQTKTTASLLAFQGNQGVGSSEMARGFEKEQQSYNHHPLNPAQPANNYPDSSHLSPGASQQVTNFSSNCAKQKSVKRNHSYITRIFGIDETFMSEVCFLDLKLSFTKYVFSF